MITCLRNSEKHVTAGSLSVVGARYQIEIATAIAGGREELRRRPIVSAIQSPISPLAFEGGLIEAAMEFARAGIPVAFMAMPLMGETAPATAAGILVVSNAESLASLVISEFASSGSPVVYASAAGGIDFRTGGATVGTPEYSIVQMGCAQLARGYNLPSEICGGGSDSKLPDIQAGFERAMSLTTSILTGADIITGLGGLNAANLMCPELLIIDDEIIEAALRITHGLEVNDDTLALDVIGKVGPGGHFLGEKHTLEHYKTETWLPKISDKGTFETWAKMGSKPMDKVAKEKVKEILATHKPEPIPGNTEKEISKILRRAETELLKKS